MQIQSSTVSTNNKEQGSCTPVLCCYLDKENSESLKFACEFDLFALR